MLQRFAQWLITSPWGKKYIGQVGAFCLGMWTMATFWKQILATCQVWGCEKSTFSYALLFIIGVTGISASIGLSVAKSKQQNDTVDAIITEIKEQTK